MIPKTLVIAAMAAVLGACQARESAPKGKESAVRTGNASAQSSQTLRGRAEEAASKGRERAKEASEQYAAEAKSRLQDLDKRIGELRSESEHAARGVRERLSALEKKRAEAVRQFDRLSSSSKEAWQDVKGGMERALGDLKEAYDKAKAHY